MGDKSKGQVKAPNLSKDYEKGIQIALKYLPKQLAAEYGYRQQYDPLFTQQALDLQHQFDPQLAGEQMAAVGRRDPEWLATHRGLGTKVQEALDRGYVDPDRAAAYGALGKQVTGDTLRGSTASPAMLHDMTQAIMSRSPGLSYGEAQNMATAVYTGQRGQALQQQRQQATNQFLGQQSERGQALAQAGSYLSSPTTTSMINQTPGVTPPRAFGYVNPNAGYQGAQYGLQNYQNQLAQGQMGQSQNPWMGALQGAGQGASMGSIGGPYGMAGGAITGAVLGGFGYPQYSSRFLKTDIKKVGEHNGLDIVEFRYKGRHVHYRGVIAEQVREKFPEVVGERNGYLTVDYDKLGIPMERQCNECKCFKPLTDFPKSQNGAAGRRSHCLECDRTYNFKLLAPRKEEHLKYHRDYYRENKEAYQVKKIMQNFGCTHAEAARLHAIRKVTESCAICGGPPTKRGFYIDHCHRSGKVRGVLCHGCNMGIGNFSDDPIKLQKAIVYLLKHLDEDEEVTPTKNNGSRTRPVETEVSNAN